MSASQNVCGGLEPVALYLSTFMPFANGTTTVWNSHTVRTHNVANLMEYICGLYLSILEKEKKRKKYNNLSIQLCFRHFFLLFFVEIETM